MAFTDRSNLYGGIYEEGINRVMRHLMRLRPSLFNCGTKAVADNPELMCQPVEAAVNKMCEGLRDEFSVDKPDSAAQEGKSVYSISRRLSVVFCTLLLFGQASWSEEAKQTYAHSAEYDTKELASKSRPRDLAPLASDTSTFILTEGGCDHGGSLLKISWQVEPVYDETVLNIRIELPGISRTSTQLNGAKGDAEFAITFPDPSPVELAIDFINPKARAQARSLIRVPYPDTVSSTLETKAADAGIHGVANIKITPCPNARKSPEDAERSADVEEREILQSERLEREEIGVQTFFELSHGRSGIDTVPDGIGFSSGLPEFDREDMATCIERAMYDNDIVGYSYAIVQNRQIFSDSSRGGGWARAPWENDAPSIAADLSTRMTIASISKPVTAMAIMTLVEAGSLSLDDAFYPIVQSEYTQAGADVEDVTIRELLTHSSGLKPNYCGKTAESIAADADFPKGYTNINYCVLREVVEHVSGQDYVDYVQTNVLGPGEVSGMNCAPTSATPTRYYADNTFGAPSSVWEDYSDTCGAYGWYASARNLGKLMAHFRNNTFLNYQTANSMRSECVGNMCLGLRKIGTSQGIAYGHGGVWIAGGGRGFRGGVVQFPRGIDGVLLMNTNKINGTSVLANAYDTAFKGGCIPPPEPPGPPTCPDTGCGTQVNGLCAEAGVYPDNSLTPLAFKPFIYQNHPDGAAAYNKYCENYPEVTDYYPAAPANDLVCAKANLSTGGPYDVCKACGADGKFWPGCECNPANSDSCGAGLSCFSSTGYGNGSTSYGTGRCWSATQGPPIWECEGDCNAVYGATGYCHHGALDFEGAGTPICASTLCNLGGKECAQQGLFCDTDSGQCQVECNGAIHNPAQGLFSCQGRGYGVEFGCNVDAQRCFIGGVAHP